MRPLPVIYAPGRVDLCALVPESRRTSDVRVFYATNRQPDGPVEQRRYGNGVDDTLHLGVASVQVGKPGATWDEVCQASRGEDGDPVFAVNRASEFPDSSAFCEAIN